MPHIEPTNENLTREEAFARLSFYVEAGVADAVTDEVQNRYQLDRDASAAPVVTADDTPRRVLSRSASTGVMSEGPAPVFQTNAQPLALDDSKAIELARELAAKAQTRDELREAVASFQGCTLSSTAKNLVFDDGNPSARIMLIGEAPGKDEDIDGVPFAGEAGRLLDRMLAAIGLNRTSVYLANMLPWRPPGNRPATASEQAICLPFITRQIELCAPDILVCVGGAAAKHLLKIDTPLPRLRGEWNDYIYASSARIPAIVLFPPDYLLRHPAHKKLAWRDLLALKARIEG